MAVLEAPPERIRFDAPGSASDATLVRAVRAGDDRAFEALYSRYHRRINAYVVGMCKDHARAEDVTQEVFVAALRRMRATEQPIAFKPWIYEIAKNACIDLFRRSRRTEEVSLEAEGGLGSADLGRLADGGPGPDAAVDAKQAIDQLCGAFGGLSDVHHEILVMRELEGLSYREIGERLGMSRPAVESTLFRARRRLTEEYDELASGQRCLRVQGIIASASTGRLGARDTRRLARHVAHCQPCRREALAAGFDAAALRQPLRTRVAEKVAALLPFPALARRLGARGGADAVAVPRGGNALPAWFAQLPALSDQLGPGWGRAVAAAAVVLAGLGAGVGTKTALGGDDHARPQHARPAARTAPAVRTAAPAPVAATPQMRAPSTRRATATARREARGDRRAARTGNLIRAGRASGGSGRTIAASGGGGRSGTPASGGSGPAGAVTHTVAPGSSTGGGTPVPSAPRVTRPTVTVPTLTAPKSAPAPVQDVAAPIEQAAAPVVGAVERTVAPVVQGAQDTVSSLLPGAAG